MIRICHIKENNGILVWIRYTNTYRTNTNLQLNPTIRRFKNIDIAAQGSFSFSFHSGLDLIEVEL